MINWINKFFRTILYKAYVIALLFFVVWAGKFIYPLIYWEFQHVGVVRNIEINKRDDSLTRMQKIRHHLDNNVQTRSHNLGDVEFVEHYEKGHFHHIGQTINEPSLNGCDYCHSVFPHIKNKDARAYRNMHGYFLACETCHYRTDGNPRSTQHKWVNTKSGKVIKRPIADKESSITSKGNYGARIAPWISLEGQTISVASLSDLREAKLLLNTFTGITKGDTKKTLVKMHKNITTKPFECDACHNTNQKVMSYQDLGYNKKERRRLMDEEIVSVISKYKNFHFPSLFQ